MRYKALIFDMDGTLVDNMDYHKQSWIELFKHHQLDLEYDTFDEKYHKVKFLRELNDFGGYERKLTIIKSIKQTDYSTIITTKSNIVKVYKFKTTKQNNEFYKSIIIWIWFKS